MKPTTKITKYISVILLLLFAISLVLMKGCGKDGGGSGGCGADAAPAGSKIIAPTDLGSPFITTNTCYPALVFLVTDAEDKPLNDICVEIFSDANIALHSGLPDCNNVSVNPKTSIITRTDDHGVISLELLTGPTPTGGTHFVEVVSGSLTAIATTAGAN